ncbi:MAG TPA: hypothetical protein VIH75_16550 [Candidatus Sulfotelmatobacter sp.]
MGRNRYVELEIKKAKANPRRHPYQGRDRQRIPRLNRENPETGAAPYVVENRRR